MTYRQWFMRVLIGSTATSAAANVAAALLLPHGHLPAAVTISVALVPPLALPIAVHSVPVAARAVGAVRGVVVLAVLVVAAAAFAASFDRLNALAAAAGHGGWTAALLPVTLDVLAGASAVALVLDPDRHADAAGDVAVQHTDASPHQADVALQEAQHQPDLAASWQPPAGGAAPVAGQQPWPQQPATDAQSVTGADAVPMPQPLHLVTTADGAGVVATSVEEQALQLVQRGVTRLDVDQVAEVLRRRAAGASQRGIARELCIDPRTVGGIVTAALEDAVV